MKLFVLTAILLDIIEVGRLLTTLEKSIALNVAALILRHLLGKKFKIQIKTVLQNT